jgi:hypothetical protein
MLFSVVLVDVVEVLLLLLLLIVVSADAAASDSQKFWSSLGSLGR